MIGITADDTHPKPHQPATRSVKADQQVQPGAESGECSGRRWHRISIRWQILTTFIVFNFIAGIVAAVVIVYNAQRAAEVEIKASMDLAERFVREVVERPTHDRSASSILRNLVTQVNTLRHVRILVADAGTGWKPLLPGDASGHSPDNHNGVPRWFSRLVNVGHMRREMKIGLDGQQIGAVLLVGYPSDEIAEVWQDTTDLAVVAAMLNLTVLGMLYFALGRVLSPLTSLATGLRELEQGQFQRRLALPRVRELADIANRFNALSARLVAAKGDNDRLTGRLIAVPDEERRQIATELHDEIGPCLFGLKANISSLDKLSVALPSSDADRIRERIATLSEITDRIQTLNRRLLSRIRPMALGHVPLSEVISGLVSDFERLDANPTLSLAIHELAEGYGDSIDLTIYRCLQESITNAVRHAEAETVKIELKEMRDAKSADGIGGAILKLSIKDDGRGMAAAQRGFGLTGMEERVRALGGVFRVTSRAGNGTRLEVTIPFDEASGHGPTAARRTVGGSRP